MINLLKNTYAMEMIDFYKSGHIVQYPDGVKVIGSNMTARSSRIPGVDHKEEI